jgi:hypothetical protein
VRRGHVAVVDSPSRVTTAPAIAPTKRECGTFGGDTDRSTQAVSEFRPEAVANFYTTVPSWYKLLFCLFHLAYTYLCYTKPFTCQPAKTASILFFSAGRVIDDQDPNSCRFRLTAAVIGGFGLYNPIDLHLHHSLCALRPRPSGTRDQGPGFSILSQTWQIMPVV